ncbi:hypothetical protein BDP27DRAFT_1365820 [Rhodocollybia butyracea]|uniref:DNA2/NAM7 helicase helicase domain-containing protein n=1 Tax=Rhodocollybia butyracea TaxID=206335 RepID=A0A9P5PLS2_9AGAR|nr:hypothetical protein BDP27DRAFT_1365820 [Rhodocollybia butyracea]
MEKGDYGHVGKGISTHAFRLIGQGHISTETQKIHVQGRSGFDFRNEERIQFTYFQVSLSSELAVVRKIQANSSNQSLKLFTTVNTRNGVTSGARLVGLTNVKRVITSPACHASVLCLNANCTKGGYSSYQERLRQNDIIARANPRVTTNEYETFTVDKEGNMALHNSRFKTRVRISNQDDTLLLNDRLTTPSCITSLPTYITHLNNSQRNIVAAMVSHNLIVIVHRPPGPGKTTTISAAAEICSKNIAEKLMKRQVDFQLIVSKEFYVEWLHIFYKFRTSLIKLRFFGDPKQLPRFGQEKAKTLQSIFEVEHLKKTSYFLQSSFHHIVDTPWGSEERSGFNWINEGETKTIVDQTRHFVSSLRTMANELRLRGRGSWRGVHVASIGEWNERDYVLRRMGVISSKSFKLLLSMSGLHAHFHAGESSQYVGHVVIRGGARPCLYGLQSNTQGVFKNLSADMTLGGGGV